jgi:short-subunit dehydrogenase
MRVNLKKLSEQVIVITGASSGIGLVTARMAASRGARLVVAARSEEGLRMLEEEINSAGGQCLAIVADVSKEPEVRRIADAAVERFGGFDTWVNNAGVSIFGKLTETPIDEQRQLFETNFWGVVYGSRIAMEHLRARGGTLINLGSVVSERAIPLQGIYSASKQAVKGFTDALRAEVEREGLPVSITLIKPTSIDTPFREHACNYLPKEANLPPPVYAPETVARVILRCAEHPTRDVLVGGAAKFISLMEKIAPRLTDKYVERVLFDQEMAEHPAGPREQHSLYGPSGAPLKERGGYEGHVAETSLYTRAALHPLITAGIVLAAAGVAAAGLAAAATATNGRSKSFKDAAKHAKDAFKSAKSSMKTNRHRLSELLGVN